jgi:hypothetical protein
LATRICLPSLAVLLSGTALPAAAVANRFLPFRGDPVFAVPRMSHAWCCLSAGIGKPLARRRRQAGRTSVYFRVGFR